MVSVVEISPQYFQEPGFAMQTPVRPKAKDAEGLFKKIAMRSPHFHGRAVWTRFLGQHSEPNEKFGRA
jgi:hypothetical protein